MWLKSEDTDVSNYEDEMIVCAQDGHSKDADDDEVMTVSQKPKNKGKEIIGSDSSAGAPGCKKNQLDIDLARQKGVLADGDGSSSDSEYMPRDSEASDEDDEAISIKKQFKEFKKLLKSGKTVNLDDLIFEGHSVLPPSKSDDEALSDKSNDTPYYDSSDDEASYDEQSDGELVRNNEDLPRYNSKSDVPFFALGMRFRGRKQFRKAIIKHGLADKRAFKFVKNELSRVRVKCTWPNCPWVMLLSKNTRTSSWQISTFNSEHMCPPRRDNKLVTSRRIAEKYEKMIRANPTWKMESLQQTVQEEMLADVHISKCKRAKKIVIDKLVDAINGEYARVFDYQAELLRTATTRCIHWLGLWLRRKIMIVGTGSALSCSKIFRSKMEKVGFSYQINKRE
jgi:alpha-galactosidase